MAVLLRGLKHFLRRRTVTRDKKDRGDPLNVDDATRSKSVSPPVDDTDWLKTAAIIFVSIGHFGHFFVEDARWWSVVGRLAAPTFFFLIGYARSRTVPLNWIWLGIILTVLESWNADWAWVAPNLLLSFAFIRLARPHVERLVERYGWVAFVVLVCGLLAVLPLAAKGFDYGSEGWLWALFGLYQRRYVDGRAAPSLRRVNAGRSQPSLASKAEGATLAASRHVRAGAVRMDPPQCEADPARRMRRRRSCIRLAGTKGVLVSSASFHGRRAGARRSVSLPVLVSARTEPPATAGERGGGCTPHR